MPADHLEDGVKHIVVGVFVSGLACVSATACGDEDLTNTVDCAQICNRFSDCVTEIDVTQCIDTCEVRADRSDEVEARTELCEECIDGASCEEAEPCWDDCPVVPVLD